MRYTFNRFFKLLYLSSGITGFSRILFYFLFCYVLFTCFFGLISYSIVVFSSFLFTFFVSFSSWLVTFLIFISGTNFFVYLTKKGDVLLITFMLILIEIVREFSRPFSLSIRLYVNISVGHTLCIVGFIFYETVFGVFFISILFILIESFVFFIQSYIFSRLVYIYLND